MWAQTLLEKRFGSFSDWLTDWRRGYLLVLFGVVIRVASAYGQVEKLNCAVDRFAALLFVKPHGRRPAGGNREYFQGFRLSADSLSASTLSYHLPSFSLHTNGEILQDGLSSIETRLAMLCIVSRRGRVLLIAVTFVP